MGWASPVSPMVDFIRAPIIATLCCEDVLEFGNKLLQYLGFSSVQFPPGARHLILETLQKLSCSSRLFLVVNRSCPCDSIICPMMVPPLSTWSWLVAFMILTGTLGRARNNVRTMYGLSREVFRLGFTRSFTSPRDASSRAVSTLSHRAGITSSLTRESLDDDVRAPGFHSVTFSWPSCIKWRRKSTDAS
jgi:hypothetical protein